jgi:acyl-homoserine lactone acylase PvdQ
LSYTQIVYMTGQGNFAQVVGQAGVKSDIRRKVKSNRKRRVLWHTAAVDFPAGMMVKARRA